jgi:DNA-binding protein H-NS
MKPIKEQSLQELQETRLQIDSLIAQRKEEEREAVLQELNAVAQRAGFSLEDLVKGSRASAKKPGSSDGRSSVAAKYKDPTSGATWSGRGVTPRWLQDALSKGKKKDDFIIK